MSEDIEEARRALRKECAAAEAEESERGTRVDAVIRLADLLLEKDAQLPQRQQDRALAWGYVQLRWARGAVGVALGVCVLTVVVLVSWRISDAVTPTRVLGAGLLAVLAVGLVKLAVHDPVPQQADEFSLVAHYAGAILSVVFAVSVVFLAGGASSGWSGWSVTGVTGVLASIMVLGARLEEGESAA